MSFYYTSKLKQPASRELQQIKQRRPTKGGPRWTPSKQPRWSAALDKKYGTNLMAQEGISQTDAASILNNMAGSYSDSVMVNAPVVIKNAATRREAMQGLLTAGQGENAAGVMSAGGQHARIRPRRGGFGRARAGRGGLGG